MQMKRKSEGKIFCKQTKPILKACLCLFIYGNGAYVSLAMKNPKFVLLTCMLLFLATKGSSVLEKKEHDDRRTCI